MITAQKLMRTDKVASTSAGSSASSGIASAGGASTLASTTSLGAMRERHLLTDASTPAIARDRGCAAAAAAKTPERKRVTSRHETRWLHAPHHGSFSAQMPAPQLAL
jgi:predicted anti-sigma-YlaC factor YlaD